MGISTVVRHLNPGTLLQVTMLLMWLALTGCGGDGDSRSYDGGISERKGVRLDISFPLPDSNLAGQTDRITMRGRAVTEDNARITQVFVNNPVFLANNKQPSAGLSDKAIAEFDQADPSRWSTQIALLRQFNEIVVEASDNRGRVRTVTLALRNAPMLTKPELVVLDTANQRALVIDLGSNALLAVDLASGDLSVISDGNTGAGPEFILPSGMVLDAANHRALVAESSRGGVTGLRALLEVDLATGNRAVISDVNTGTGPVFSGPDDVALDAVNNRALVADIALVAVDLTNGNRSVISDANTGTGPEFSSLDAVALDAANNRALVYDDDLKALLAVYLNTGDRSLIADASTGAGPIFTYSDLTRVELDATNDRALLLNDWILDASLLAVDLASGDRSVISDANTGAGPMFISPRSLAIDMTNHRALVTDRSLGALLTVDLESGTRSIIAGKNTGTEHSFESPQGVALDKANRRELLTDRGLGALLAVDLASGDLSVISDSNIGVGPAFRAPEGVALDASNDRALVTDSILGSLLAVDLASGDRSVISDKGTGAGPEFHFPTNIVLDPTNQRALVMEDSRGLNALLAVNLASGDRSVISDGNTGIGPGFNFPTGIALDGANHRALVMDSGIDALLAIDLSSGNRTIISDANIGTGPNFNDPESVVLDAANHRALVADRSIDAMLAVDLASGDRSFVSGLRTGAGPAFSYPTSVALDAADHRAFVVEDSLGLNALLAVDLDSGDRVIVLQ